jgi:hypothetical protein
MLPGNDPHADPVLALRRDVKDLGRSLDPGLLIGRVHLAKVLGAVADYIDGPTGH